MIAISLEDEKKELLERLNFDDIAFAMNVFKMNWIFLDGERCPTPTEIRNKVSWLLDEFTDNNNFMTEISYGGFRVYLEVGYKTSLNIDFRLISESCVVS